MLLCLGALGICLVAVSRTPWAQQYAGYKATDVLREQLQLMASIGEVEIEPFQLSVVARNIVLDHTQYGRTIEAASLRIRPSWWALLRGELDLHHITIERATVRLVVRDGALANLPTLPEAPPGDTSGELALPFNFVNIVDSHLIVDAAPLAQADMGRINIRLDASNNGSLAAELTAWDGWVEHQTGRDVLNALELSAVLSHDALQVELARIATPDVELSVRSAQLQFPLLKGAYDGTVALELDLAKLSRWPHGITLPDFKGKLRVQARLSGDAKGPTADAHVALDGGAIFWYGLGEHLELDVKVAKDGLTFEGFTKVLKRGGRVDLRGKLGFGKGLPLDSHATIHDLSFAKLMETLDVSPNAIVDWTLAGDWTLRGTLDPLELSGPLVMPTRDFQITRDAYHVRPARPVMHIDTAKLNGTVAIRPRGLSLENVDIQLPNSKLHADVLLGFDNNVRAKAVTSELELSDLSPLLDFPLGGRGGFDAEVGGTFQQPTVSGTLGFQSFAFNTYPFGDVDGDFELEQSLMAVHFGRLDARKRDSNFHVDDLRLDFNDHKLAIGADLTIDKLTLRDFYDTFHWEGDERYDPYQGEVTGKTRIDYTLGFPSDSPSGTLVADIDLDVPRASVDGYALTAGHFAGNWRWLDHAKGYTGGELTVEHFAMQKGKGTVSLSGKMAEGGKLDLVVIADRLDARDTEGLSDRLPGLEGSFGVTAEVKGTAALPRVHADVVASDLRLGDQPLGASRLYVRLTDKRDPWIAAALAWPRGEPPTAEDCGHAREGLARGVWPEDPPLRTSDGPLTALDEPMGFVICGKALGGALDIDLMVGRTQVLPVRGRLGIHHLDVGRLVPRKKHGTPLQASVDGELRLLGGALLVPTTLIGDVTFQELRAGQLDVELRNVGPVRASFDRGSFAVSEARFTGPGSELVLSGGGDLAGGLGLSMDGRADLGLLTHLSSSVSSAAGAVELHFKLSGSLAAPQVFGHAELQGASLALASYDKPIDALSGKLTFSAQRVLFEGFRAQVAGGHVSVDGVATLKGQSLGSLDLELNAEHLDLSPRDGIRLQVGGRGQLAWREGTDLPRLTGTLRLEEMIYTRPIKMGRTLDDMVKKERAEVALYDPDNDLIELDLAVVQAKPLHIENNLIDAELVLRDQKQPFRLVGTDQRMGVLGNMAVKKGTVRFRDATFNIRQGDISFDSRTRIDPTFDIVAVSDVRRQNNLNQGDWHISIHAWGNRDSFQFQLQSDPYLSEDDIALLLTVGMTHSELSQLEAGDLTGTAALEALATVSGVEREVHRALPQIDDFHIASAYSERSNRTEPQLFIGKRINDRVRLSASTGIAESRDFSTGVELQITEETSVEAVYNNQNSTSSSQLGDVGVDLKWRLEFD
jgi:translocation and assembly module TamB